MIRRIKNIYHLILAVIANLIYGFPGKKLTIIGVTGTDGKTTTTSLIYHILKSNGKKVGMISTIGAKINDQDYSIGFHATTPSPILLQKLLHIMVINKCDYAILEVTSHAIDQNRIWGIPFYIGVLTNITHEHLDYHLIFENYFQAKADFLKKCRLKIINRDDQSFKELNKILNGKRKIITYSLNNQANYVASNISSNNDKQNLFINKTQINSKLLGKHNVYNILAAFSVVCELGIDGKNIQSAIETFVPVPGRLEIILKQPFKVVVDFAHTPNALQNILPTVKKLTTGKLIHVFGATGKRDVTKRQKMGEISGQLADYSIITSEDTYGEDPSKIIAQIEEGIKKTLKNKDQNYWIITNRKEAIKKGLSLAQENDLVLLTGVGHQTSLNLGNRELPWSEKEIVLELLNKK